MSSGGGGSSNGVTEYRWSDPMSFYWNDQGGTGDGVTHGLLPNARGYFDSLAQNGFRAPTYRSTRGQGRDQYLEDDSGRIQSMDTLSRDSIEGIGSWGRNYTNTENGRRPGTTESSGARRMINETLAGTQTNPAVWNSRTQQTIPTDFERAATETAGAAQTATRNNSADPTLTSAGLRDQHTNTVAAPDDLQVNANQYAGLDSPYFNQQLQRGARDITDAYQRGTSADTRRMMNMAGIFGGGAHQQAQANNEAGLGRTLENYTSGMLNSQYDRSANLSESDIGRRMSAGQFNIGNDIGVNTNNAQMLNNMGQFNANMRQGANQFDNSLLQNNRQFNAGQGNQLEMYNAGQVNQGRQFDVGQQNNMNQFNSGARNNMSQFDRNLQNSAYDSERNRQMGAVGQAFGADEATLGAYRAMAGAGDARTAYNQGIRNLDYGDFQNAQNYPWEMFNRYGNILGQAQGGINATQIQSGGGMPGISPLAGLLGAGAMYGAFRSPT